MAPRESLREAQKQFTHERLLKAAVDEFTLKGYNATTVDDIVVRAGATRATFYLHFKGKADMILELMKWVRHSRHEHGMRVMSVPQKQRAGPNASTICSR
jgi:AcrR family transcriptional regulator